MSTRCEDLKAAINAATDPKKKAALEAEYQRECGVSAQDSGGNGPGPTKPGQN